MIGEVVGVHSLESSLRCVFLKVVWDSRLVKEFFRMFGSEAPRAMSDFISKYCEIFSLISRGRSEYSIVGQLAICKGNLELGLRDVKFIINLFKRELETLLIRLVSFGELGLWV